MKALNVGNLTISRNGAEMSRMSKEESENLAGAAGYLMAMLNKSQLTFDMFGFTAKERAKAVNFAIELLCSGEI